MLNESWECGWGCEVDGLMTGGVNGVVDGVRVGVVVFFKQKTAYDVAQRDWSSGVLFRS